MSATQTLLGIISLCLILIAIIVFLLICIIAYKVRHEFQDVSLLLICNTCIAMFLTCLTVCIMIISNLTTGFLISNLIICYLWGLLYDLFECSIYYSICLQAFYRLCRIVFYRKKSLTSFSLYIILIVSQWIFITLLLLPPIPLRWYARIPTERYCLIPYTNINAEIYHIIILYIIPLISISTIYTWIIIFIRYYSRTSTVIIAARQRQRNLRDLTIVKNIVILIVILIILRLPTVMFMIYGIITGDLYPFTYSIVGLITSTCLVLIELMIIYITPPLRKNICIIFSSCRRQAHIQEKIQSDTQKPVATLDSCS